MAIKTLIFSTPLLLLSLQSYAGSTLDAALGGAIGGATGAAIGNEIGGRDGAILGGALGGATGAAITTDNNRSGSHTQPSTRVEVRQSSGGNNNGSFCPPGQRKKGRC